MRIFGTDLGNYGMLGVDLFLGLDVLVQKKMFSYFLSLFQLKNTDGLEYTGYMLVRTPVRMGNLLQYSRQSSTTMNI